MFRSGAHKIIVWHGMPVTDRDEEEDRLESRSDAERRSTASATSKVLFGIAAVVLVTGVVGNALVWTSWTTVYRTQSSPTAWLWGQFLAGIALPVGLAGLLAGAGLLVAHCDRERRR